MAETRIFIHAVWGVKDRYPLLTEPFRDRLIRHIIDNAREKQVSIIALDGHLDHLHCLFRLSASQSVAQVLQLIKGESARWANSQEELEKPLYWARSYYARSVDEANLTIVKQYIRDQHKHDQPLSKLPQRLNVQF